MYSIIIVINYIFAHIIGNRGQQNYQKYQRKILTNYKFKEPLHRGSSEKIEASFWRTIDEYNNAPLFKTVDIDVISIDLY